MHRTAMAAPVRPRLIVTDLDGTLWGPSGRVHDDTRAALATIDAMGIPVVGATGRSCMTAVEALLGNGLPLPLLALDGAVGVHSADGRRFHEHPMEPRSALEALRALAAHDLHPAVHLCGRDLEVAVGPTYSGSADHLAHLGRRAGTVAGLADLVGAADVFAMSVVGLPRAPLALAAERVGAAARATVMRDKVYGGWSLRVVASGVDKWSGVEAYCRHAGIESEDVLAVGDGENDLELLRRAAFGCAVSDSCQELLDLADHVVPVPDAGGWGAIVSLLAPPRAQGKPGPPPGFPTEFPGRGPA